MGALSRRIGEQLFREIRKEEETKRGPSRLIHGELCTDSKDGSRVADAPEFRLLLKPELWRLQQPDSGKSAVDLCDL
jgi:hypothetical protein